MNLLTPRIVLPELLDHLSPDDPRARRSRRDLQRIHVLMRTLPTLRNAIGRLNLGTAPRRILELGAGDGTLLLRLARKVASRWAEVELTLLDCQDLIDSETHRAYRDLGWRVTFLKADVLDWARTPQSEPYDLCLTTLFLHHFAEKELATILAAVAARCDAFLACEPRRDLRTHVASRFMALMGGNHITRADAVTSVAAGFTGQELSHAWPNADDGWILQESRVLPFTHLFSAQAHQHHCHGADA